MPFFCKAKSFTTYIETQRARNSPYIKCDLDIPYGDNEDETVDIYQNTDGNSGC